MFKVSLCQISPKLMDKKSNLHKILEIVEKVSEKHSPDLIVFPELSLTGYSCGERLQELAEHIPGEATFEILKIVKKLGVNVIFGMPEKTDQGIYNSAVFISPKETKVYRKIFLPNFWIFREKKYFKHGCAVHFPEVFRISSVMGAQVIIVISATPKESLDRFKKLLKARAIENQCYIVYVNRVGTEENVVFGGESQVIDPMGEIYINASCNEECIVNADLDMNKVMNIRKKVPLLEDFGNSVFKGIYSRYVI
ncbi:MAG: carbon-nitrogen hydrolase family protein [Candidatus Odinarchaeia archaeon]